LQPKKQHPDANIMGKRGTMAYLLGRNEKYQRYPFAVLNEWIDPPLLCQQFAFFYRWNDSHPVGYVTWAFLAPDVEERWKTDPEVSLHPSEWNEDGNLWIMDFLAEPGFCADIVEFIQQELFPGHQQAYALRRNDDGSVRKISCWKRRRNHR
jgi:cytolysin-activating lysine-acyltransferase